LLVEESFSKQLLVVVSLELMKQFVQDLGAAVKFFPLALAHSTRNRAGIRPNCLEVDGMRIGFHARNILRPSFSP
jgi:hypothetical protein